MRRAPVRAALLVCLPLLTASGVETPQPSDWGKLVPSRFDTRWIVPDDRGASDTVGADLSRDLKRLADRRFPLAKDSTAPSWTVSLGDVLREMQRRGGDDRAAIAVMRELNRTRPEVWKAVRWCLPSVARDDGLAARGWDPSEDARDDGLLDGRDLDRQRFGAKPWTSASGTDVMVQCAAVFWADLVAIKEAECDYAAQSKETEDTNAAIGGTYVCGDDPLGRPFTAYALEVAADLPFPYSGYKARVRVLSRVDDDGHMRTDIYSTSRDFYWFAGQDTFVPVRAADGEWVATLGARVYGFDLRGVPDGDSDRREALRSSFGRLKLRAEARFAARGERPPVTSGDVPRVTLTGVRTTR